MNEHTIHAATHLTAHLPAPEEHLSDKQFTDAMLGMADTSTEFHLAHCAICKAEAEQWNGAIATFAETGRAWSERQPVPAAAKNIRTRALMYSMRPVMGFAAAAIAVVCIAIPVGRNQRAAQHIAMADTSALHLPSPSTRVIEVNTAPVKVRAEKMLAQAVHTNVIAPDVPVAAPSDTLEQDNALMAAIGAEIASPMSGSIESAARTATIAQ